MCWKVTFGHRFDYNFCTVKNFCTQPECFKKYTFGTRIWTQILYFFDGNRESYCPLNMSHWVIQNTDSTYGQMEGHKNGRLMICPQIWQENIFPILWDQSHQNKILGKKYVSGKLFTSSNRLKNVLKSDLWSSFWQ